MLLRLYKVVKNLGMEEHDIKNVFELAKEIKTSIASWDHRMERKYLQIDSCYSGYAVMRGPESPERPEMATEAYLSREEPWFSDELQRVIGSLNLLGLLLVTFTFHLVKRFSTFQSNPFHFRVMSY